MDCSGVTGDDGNFGILYCYFSSVQLHSTMDDISISGLGWLSIKGTEGNKLFDVRVPDTVRVFRYVTIDCMMRWCL